MVIDTTGTTTRTTRRRRRLRRKRIDGWPSRTAFLGGWLALTLGFAVLSFGGVHAPSRAVLHGLLAVGCGLAVWQHDRLLADVGRVGTLSRMVAVAAGVMALGLVPLPAMVLRWVQPGTAAAAPDRWHTLSWSVPDTVDALTLLGLGGGALVIAGVWAASQPRHRTIERAAAVGTAIVAGTAALHAATGATALFGMFDTWVVPPDRFFAPFLNDNHLASILLLVWPMWVDHALDARRAPIDRWMAAGIAALLGGLFVATGSLGATVVAVGVALAVAVDRERVPRAFALGGATVAVIALIVLDPLSEHGRTDLWAASLALWADHPLFGSGAGTFGHAIAAYRTDLDFVDWHHAHNEALQWLAETGLVGALGLGLGLRWWARQPVSRTPRRDRWMVLGVLGVLLHGLVEFPLHIPGILLVVAALFAIDQVGLRDPEPSVPRRVRLALGVLACVQLAMGAWQARTALEQRAVRTVLAQADDAGRAADRLARVAPWRPEIGLYRAWSLEAAERGGEAAAAARAVAAEHPVDPVAQRLAAGVLARQGQLDEARTVVERAVARDPSDWRQWLGRAAIVEQHEPAATAEAWLEAIRRGAPAVYVRRAWSHLPVGLAWVEAVAGRPPRLARAMGHALAELDPEAALVAFEQATVDDGHVDPGHIRLLMRLDRLSEADFVLRRALTDRPSDPRLLRLQAELRARQGRHDEAARAWLLLVAEDPAAQLEALRATRRAEGVEAALALAEMLMLERGASALHPAARLEHARLLRDADRREACTDRIRRSGLLTDERYAAAARATLGECSR